MQSEVGSSTIPKGIRKVTKPTKYNNPQTVLTDVLEYENTLSLQAYDPNFLAITASLKRQEPFEQSPYLSQSGPRTHSQTREEVHSPPFQRPRLSRARVLVLETRASAQRLEQHDGFTQRPLGSLSTQDIHHDNGRLRLPGGDSAFSAWWGHQLDVVYEEYSFWA